MFILVQIVSPCQEETRGTRAQIQKNALAVRK